MISMVKAQLGIAMEKKGFQISFIVVLAYALFTSLYYAFKQKGMDISYTYNPAIVSGLTADSKWVWMFCRVFPFLAVFPAGYSIFADNSTRIISILQTKKGVFKYYMSKIISAFILGFIVFSVPFLIELLLNIIIFPLSGGKAITGWPMESEEYFRQGAQYIYAEFFYNNVYLYMIASALTTGLFGGCASVFIASFGAWKIPYKILMFLPLYVVLYVSQTLFGADYFLDFYWTAYDGSPKHIAYYFAYMAVLFLAGSVITLTRGKCSQL